MIYCVWYPSGGFGHFVNSVLNLHGYNFVRPKSKLIFSSKGNSHNLDYVAPPYLKNQDSYQFDFDQSHNYSVIVDNGINNESEKFLDFFPDAVVIKMCYSDYSWPVVATTMLAKAMNIDPHLHLNPGPDWDAQGDWVQREKYFLYLRDHPLRHAWKPNSNTKNLFVETLMRHNDMVSALESFGIKLQPFADLHQQWQAANHQYFDPVIAANKFVSGQQLDQPITDIWTQAVVYYQIWCRYGVEVPHNDFSNFFASQQEFQQWVKSV